MFFFFQVSIFSFIAIYFLSFFCQILSRFSIFLNIFFTIMSETWNFFLVDNDFSKSTRFFFDILKSLAQDSKYCQKCIKYLTINSFLKCVFKLSKKMCNQCTRLNAICVIVDNHRWDDWLTTVDSSKLILLFSRFASILLRKLSRSSLCLRVILVTSFENARLKICARSWNNENENDLIKWKTCRRFVVNLIESSSFSRRSRMLLAEWWISSRILVAFFSIWDWSHANILQFETFSRVIERDIDDNVNETNFIDKRSRVVITIDSCFSVKKRSRVDVQHSFRNDLDLESKLKFEFTFAEKKQFEKNKQKNENNREREKRDRLTNNFCSSTSNSNLREKNLFLWLFL